MKEIILTGYDEKGFRRLVEKEEMGGCYLCKRHGKGIYLVKDGDDEGMGSEELGLKFFNMIDDGREFLFPLCYECHMLLRAFVEKLLFQKEFGEKV